METTQFPWDSLRAETLRNICKDLGAGPEAKRRRENMISFLKDVEKRGTAKAASEREENEGIPKTPETVQAATILASMQKRDHVDGQADWDADSLGDDDRIQLDEDEDACVNGCQNGWLSPRLKFILHQTAASAHNSIIQSLGFMAINIYLGHLIPPEVVPRVPAAPDEWARVFSLMFKSISDIFEAGEIPNATRLEISLVSDETKHELYRMYAMTGADCGSMMEALVNGAQEMWKDSQINFTGDPKWTGLPACPNHDLDWKMAEAVLLH